MNRVFRLEKRLLVMSMILMIFGLFVTGCIQAQNSDGNITLNFALQAGDEAVECGKSYAGIGTDPVAIEIKDARFYLSDIALINAQGESVPLALTEDGKWQSNGVALLDFEDGSGPCSEIGNADLNSQVIGTLPAGLYNGLSFQLGIPFELNHQDVVAAETPLNIPALWWNWQYGYKFARIDLQTDAAAPDNQYFIHLGSTGCGEAMEMDMGAAEKEGEMAEGEKADSAEEGGMDMGDAQGGGMGAAAPEAPCNNPNVVTVELTNFDPSQSVIVADLAALLESVNVKESTPAPAGCMSGTDDPDCRTLLPSFGLSLSDGQCLLAGCSDQRFFRLAQRVQ